MEILFEIIFQFFGELLFQLLAELGFRSLAAPFQKSRNPVSSAFGSVIWGGILGGISLLVFRNAMLETGTLKLLNLIITPVCAGAMMVMMERWLAARGRKPSSFAQFQNAYLFAFAFALIRFIWAG